MATSKKTRKRKPSVAIQFAKPAITELVDTRRSVHCNFECWIDIDKIAPNPNNPNQHSEEQIERLAKLLNHYGWRHPIIVSKESGYIVAGHGRLLAAKKLDDKQVPISVQSFASPDDEYGFLCADNAIAAWAELDFSSINAFVMDFGPDYDLDLLGIKDFVLEPADKYGDQDGDEIPEIRKTDIKPGDFFALGNHRLLCGDSTDQNDVEKLMNGGIAIACITDPPYSVDYENQKREPGRKTRKQKGDEYKDPINAADLLKSIFKNIPTDVLVMSFPVNKHFHDLSDASKEWDLLYDCLWLKNHFAFIIGRRYQPRHEPILIFRRKKYNKSTFNVPANQSTVFEYTKTQKNPDHPTPKPIELYERLVEYHSDHGDIIFDPFAGSGTTLIACERKNRICMAIEKEPRYVQLIIDRWEKITGLKAEQL